MKQTEQILKHLRTRGGITAIDSLNEYGVFRLAARIKDLRDQNYDIQTIRLTQGEKTFAKYVLRSDHAQG